MLCDSGLAAGDPLRGALAADGREGPRRRRRLGGSGLVDGRPVFCYAQDSGYAGGSLGEAHADTIVRVLELADRARAPVVGFVASGGARMQEGVAALGGYGRIFRRIVALSGRVPQISIITGVSAGGGRLLAGADRLGRDDRGLEHVPDRPRRRQRGPRRGRDRRGARRHARPRAQRGLPLRRPTDLDAAFLARELLGYLPRHRDLHAAGSAVPAAELARPVGLRSGRGRARLRRARRDRGDRRRRRPARGLRRLGAQPGHRPCPHRRAHRSG